MKYSILIPYSKRESLKSSLLSFVHHYSNRTTDFEVIIIEDIVNFEDPIEHQKLMSIIKDFEGSLIIRFYLDDYRSFNPSKKFNIGFKKSSGDIIVF
jgi:hypothetical protein